MKEVFSSSCQTFRSRPVFEKMASPMKRENGRPGSRGYQPFLTARLASYKSQIKKVYKPRSLSLKEFVVKFLTMRALTTLSRSLICTLSNQSTFFLSIYSNVSLSAVEKSFIKNIFISKKQNYFNNFINRRRESGKLHRSCFRSKKN